MDENTNTTTITSPGLGDYYALIKAEHEANNAWSAEQAQKAMDYQTEMSNSAHQREVADLKAAGLNPVLSAGGSGATTGSGLQAQRGDENVAALYGLTKMAFESSIAQSKAMNNIAHYVSGSSGYSSGSTDSLYVSPNGINTGNGLLDGLLDVGADWLFRTFGIRQKTAAAIVNGIIGVLNEWDEQIHEEWREEAANDPHSLGAYSLEAEDYYKDSPFKGLEWANAGMRATNNYLDYQSKKMMEDYAMSHPDAVTSAAKVAKNVLSSGKKLSLKERIRGLGKGSESRSGNGYSGSRGKY